MRLIKNIFLIVLLLPTMLIGQVKAFTSASGAGSSTTGGRGGTVIRVTNLNDSGAGSFRAAFTTSGTRTIVFDVSGTINLTSNMITAYGNVTVAGQTAPAGGITFTGNTTPMFEISGRDNMIFRYIRVRPTFQYNNDNADAMQFNNCTNIILDHVSTSWGGDEVIDFLGSGGNITVQNSILSESKTGMIMGDSNTPANFGNASVLGNLWFHTDHRHPNSASNSNSDVINNVIWGYGYRTNKPVGSPKINEINNYWMTDSARPIFEMSKIAGDALGTRIYSKGNLHLPTTITDPNLANNNNTWTAFGTSDKAFGFTYNSVDYYDDDPMPSEFFVSTPYPLSGSAWTTMTALESLEYVKTNVGANKTIDGSGVVSTTIDAVDTYYINNITNGTNKTVEFPFQMTGKAHYTSFQSSISSTPINSRGAGYDTDNDGMPDVWENATFGNLTRTGTGDLDADGYTDLEEYLNLVDNVETPEPPVVLPSANRFRMRIGTTIFPFFYLGSTKIYN